MGKLAIGRIISEREHNSWLSGLWYPHRRDEALGRMWGGWAQGIVRILATGRRASARDQLFEDLTLITFNYDRCAESALFHAVMRTFNVGEQEAAETMAGLRVIRPYGGLGPLPWAGRAGEPFGNQAADLFELAERILVYTDDQGERPDLEEMRREIARSRNLIALGFGFHPLNMRLLAAEPESGIPPRFIATAVMEPVPRRVEIAERVLESFRVRDAALAHDQLDCSNLIAQYGGQVSA